MGYRIYRNAAKKAEYEQKGNTGNTQMTKKWQRFCREYINDYKQEKAALRAGYSKRTARSIASELMQKPEILAEIETLENDLRKKYEATADRVIKELSRLAFIDPKNLLQQDGTPKKITDLDENTRRAIQELTVTKSGDTKLKLYDKQKSLEMLGRTFAMFTDVSRAEGSIDINIQDITTEKKQDKAKK